MGAIDVVRNVVEDYPGGAGSLAPRIGKAQSSLSHEVAESGNAKLGLATTIKIVNRTREVRILAAIAADCGYVGLFIPSEHCEPSDDGVAHVTEMVKELSDVATSFGRALADGKVTPNEREAFLREAGELMGAVQRACAYVEAVHQRSLPGGGA